MILIGQLVNVVNRADGNDLGPPYLSHDHRMGDFEHVGLRVADRVHALKAGENSEGFLDDVVWLYPAYLMGSQPRAKSMLMRERIPS